MSIQLKCVRLVLEMVSILVQQFWQLDLQIPQMILIHPAGQSPLPGRWWEFQEESTTSRSRHLHILPPFWWSYERCHDFLAEKIRCFVNISGDLVVQ